MTNAVMLPIVPSNNLIAVSFRHHSGMVRTSVALIVYFFEIFKIKAANDRSHNTHRVVVRNIFVKTSAGKVSFAWDCNPGSATLQTFNLPHNTKLTKSLDTTKPPLGKVEALFHVVQHIITNAISLSSMSLSEILLCICLWQYEDKYQSRIHRMRHGTQPCR